MTNKVWTFSTAALQNTPEGLLGGSRQDTMQKGHAGSRTVPFKANRYHYKVVPQSKAVFAVFSNLIDFQCGSRVLFAFKYHLDQSKNTNLSHKNVTICHTSDIYSVILSTF